MIAKASAAFVRLRGKVWDRSGIRLDTKLKVYRAVVLPTPLYTCETCTVYQRHAKRLNHFHTSCLGKLLKIKWQDRILDTEVLQRAECTYSSETGTVKMDMLCYQDAWGTLAKEILYGETLPWWSEEAIQRHPQSLPQGLQHTNRVVGTIAQNRAKWRGLIRRGASEYEAKRTSEAEQKRAQRKARAKALLTELSCSDLCCSICNRQFRARIGLISYLRTQQ